MTRETYIQPCPGCGQKCRWTHPSPRWMCPGCGRELPLKDGQGGLAERIGATLFPEESPDGLVLGGRALGLVALAVWGLHFIAMDPATNAIGRSFLHPVNLAFHEAGHVLCQPFGGFLHVLGGSLFQVLVPLTVAGAFLVRLHPVGAGVGLWWAGQSLMDVAVYIYDARRMTLPLLTGGTGRDHPGTHDWNNLLSWMGMLSWDHALARAAHWTGAGIMLFGLGWGAVALVRGWRGRKTHEPV